MVTEDKAGYTSLKKGKELINFETRADVQSEYPEYPQSVVYEEIADSPVRHNDTHPQSDQGECEYAVHDAAYLPPSTQRYINQAVAKATEEEHKYDYPQMQSNEYEEVTNSYKD